MPDTNPTVPRRTRHHPALSKQTPIDSGHKLRVRGHPTHVRRFAPEPDGAGQLVVSPHPHTHVIAAACQDVFKVRGPRDLAHGIAVAVVDRHRPGIGVIGGEHARVEDADFAVDGADGEGVWVVFVPVVG